MKFAVTVVAPPGYPHAAAFLELAETMHAALTALGHDSVLTTEGQLPGRRHIVLGANLLPGYPLPLAPDAILYNLEQVQMGSSWFRPELLDLLPALHPLGLQPAQHRRARRPRHRGRAPRPHRVRSRADAHRTRTHPISMCSSSVP